MPKTLLTTALLAVVAWIIPPSTPPEDIIPNQHGRPIVEEEGRTLLWANADDWFDVTGMDLDPHEFQFGIGRDKIPSVDAPRFVPMDHPEVADHGLDETRMDVVASVVARTTDRIPAAPNIDLALGAMTFVTGMQPDAGEVIFAIARTAGWIAHALEEYEETPIRFRPVGRYVARQR